MIGVIDIGSGNIPSVCSALKKNLERFKLCSNAKDLKNIKRIILPGVGSFKSFIENIYNKDLITSIKKAILNGMPFLGICLGFQALFEKSYELNETMKMDLMINKLEVFICDKNDLKTMKFN